MLRSGLVSVHEGPAALAPPRRFLPGAVGQPLASSAQVRTGSPNQHLLVGAPLPSSASPCGHRASVAVSDDGDLIRGERLPGPVLCVALTAMLMSCSRVGFSSDDVCTHVECSGHGQCAIDPSDNSAVCLCQFGYLAEGLSCEPDGALYPCIDITCSDHGRCIVVENQPRCLCDPGFQETDDQQCVAATSPCSEIDCSGHGTCIIAVDCRITCACDQGYHSDGEVACLIDMAGG